MIKIQNEIPRLSKIYNLIENLNPNYDILLNNRDKNLLYHKYNGKIAGFVFKIQAGRYITNIANKFYNMLIPSTIITLIIGVNRHTEIYLNTIDENENFKESIFIINNTVNYKYDTNENYIKNGYNCVKYIFEKNILSLNPNLKMDINEYQEQINCVSSVNKILKDENNCNFENSIKYIDKIILNEFDKFNLPYLSLHKINNKIDTDIKKITFINDISIQKGMSFYIKNKKYTVLDITKNKLHLLDEASNKIKYISVYQLINIFSSAKKYFAEKLKHKLYLCFEYMGSSILISKVDIEDNIATITHDKINNDIQIDFNNFIFNNDDNKSILKKQKNILRKLKNIYEIIGIYNKEDYNDLPLMTINIDDTIINYKYASSQRFNFDELFLNFKESKCSSYFDYIFLNNDNLNINHNYVFNFDYFKCEKLIDEKPLINTDINNVLMLSMNYPKIHKFKNCYISKSFDMIYPKLMQFKFNDCVDTHEKIIKKPITDLYLNIVKLNYDTRFYEHKIELKENERYLHFYNNSIHISKFKNFIIKNEDSIFMNFEDNQKHIIEYDVYFRSSSVFPVIAKIYEQFNDKIGLIGKLPSLTAKHGFKKSKKYQIYAVIEIKDQIYILFNNGIFVKYSIIENDIVKFKKESTRNIPSALAESEIFFDLSAYKMNDLMNSSKYIRKYVYKQNSYYYDQCNANYIMISSI
jgi:hypothetical protein